VQGTDHEETSGLQQAFVKSLLRLGSVSSPYPFLRLIFAWLAVDQPDNRLIKYFDFALGGPKRS
jgi:hypothetical protein